MLRSGGAARVLQLRPLLQQQLAPAATTAAAAEASCHQRHQAVRWFSGSDAGDKQQQQQTAAAPPAAQQQQQPSQQQPQQQQHRSSIQHSPEEDWTEVIDEKTGQNYWWNEKTGETTELGEPRPRSRFHDQSWQEAAGASGPFQEGWREPPGRDLTYIYSVLGVAIGVGMGWCTQYWH